MKLPSISWLSLVALAASCTSGNSPNSILDASSGTDAASDANTGTSCALATATTPTGASGPSGCAVLARDVSACAAARTAQGLSGFWLKFSCRVTLTATTVGAAQVVRAVSDDQPDYRSNYFALANACHEAYTGGVQNPNVITPYAYTIDFPTAPNATSTAMAGGAVGLALNGVAIYSNMAAPGDDIYVEAATFDRCGAHPDPTGRYHYHGEPYALSYDDASFIGVLRDGYPVYGRKDPDGSYPTLDAQGGHTGVTVDSPGTPVYHYHLNQQTSTATGTAGQMQWFLTKGSYHGAPSTCPTCM